MIRLNKELVEAGERFSVSFTDLEARVTYRVSYFTSRKAAVSLIRKEARAGERIEDYTREGVPTFLWKGRML